MGLTPHWYATPEGALVIVGIITCLVIGWQSWETRRAAEAALLSAKVSVNAERSWVMTDILWSADVPNVQRETRLRLMEGSGTDGETTTVDVCLVCKNDGKTPAWITERKLWLKIFDEAPSARPDTTTPPSFTLGGPESLSVGEVSKVDAQLTCSGRRPQVGGALVMYGVVKYRDVFGKHETWCGYTVVGDPRNVRLQRLAEYPEYNKNT